ncbi:MULTISPECIES: NAD(P)-binding oxidoreductase [unclassified Pseudomonas]|uniref:NAD(P)-binding oxidoreductase n=1 Tax=unclassified Pseudomonas TaxID=196821 RepID=UPI000C86B2B7|nr:MULTISPECIES: NAD(P)-binding oxidoreductase [unclassified Pseudomonas]PMV22835.1 NAD-dependent dehydratase [Pseudomonas sp. FW305-3-2-15-C-TSA2]PMV29497.1 NAD-dependent dehydratase [Pseudomonas sp. DP16D-L5]PMV39400.1 NAD-dependent dehydratase [Pseudomonas sp. FW305-3-2-15-A-LB2]PMV45710.1 NAD-dependent dehydratase [Pseudomonas sp. FW305-3-2-15-C-R2A1]PMV52063.1 NAD-dependent dehydratase [Pseudomonas sp. FW305-3-2-15-C-LB1]
MNTVFIVGGSGKVARSLAQQLAKRGHQPRSLYRHAEQADELKALGAEPVAGNLLELDTDALAKLMAGSDTVVFAAGAGGKGGAQMTDAIDGRGLELSVAAAQQAGIRRFVLVSAFPEASRGKTVSETFENYMAVKKRADVHLAATDLDWVILRPGTLLDSAGTGKVRAGLAIPYGDVPREDVAAALLQIIEQPHVNRVIIELTQGTTPVADAIQHVARDYSQA